MMDQNIILMTVFDWIVFVIVALVLMALLCFRCVKDMFIKKDKPFVIGKGIIGKDKIK